ncbi:MAG: hypothetical protein JWO91_3039 [Acidobacteriaceae bacterium]|nr:hypothetical protein [Acidobacteriaceae bacterium]
MAIHIAKPVWPKILLLTQLGTETLRMIANQPLYARAQVRRFVIVNLCQDVRSQA